MKGKRKRGNDGEREGTHYSGVVPMAPLQFHRDTYGFL